MPLLDVPPEIFQRIIEIYVSTLGVRKAAKARGVARTFLSYINEEIFARQPVNKLKTQIPKRLVKKNHSFFLERRTAATHGAPDLLPATVTRLVNYVIEIVGPDTRENRITWTKKIPAVVAKHSPNALLAALTPTKKEIRDYIADITSCLALIVAIHLEDHNLTTRLLEFGANPWDSSSLFGGNAIQIASKMQATPLVTALLSDAHGDCDKFGVKKRSEIIYKCIYRALGRRNSPLAIKLLSWHVQNLGKHSDTYSSWFVEEAVSIDDLPFVQVMHTSGYLDAKKRSRAQDIIRGLLRNPHPRKMLRYLDANNLIDVYRCYRGQPCDEVRFLLDLAIHHSCVPVAKAVFSVSAHVRTKHSLRQAISQNNITMVELLLNNGADPEGLDSWRGGPEFHRSTCELARPGFKVYKTVRDSAGRYTPPEFWVWDAEKQMKVPMAYTFHAPEL